MKYYFLIREPGVVLIYRDDGETWIVKVVFDAGTIARWCAAAATKEYVRSKGVRVCTAIKYLQERGLKITRAELIR